MARNGTWAGINKKKEEGPQRGGRDRAAWGQKRGTRANPIVSKIRKGEWGCDERRTQEKRSLECLIPVM